LHEIDTWYGGARGSELFQPGERAPVTAATAAEPQNDRLSIHHWAQHGIQGRGVLLDVARYAARIGLPDFHPFAGQDITVEHLEAVAKLEGVELRQADILVVRTGLIGAYKAADAAQQDKWLRDEGRFSGVENSDAMRRFLWDTHLGAVAGDAVGFERMPPDGGSNAMLRARAPCSKGLSC
jgi:hypothetical protein